MTPAGRRRIAWRDWLALWVAGAGALWLAWQLFQFSASTNAGSSRPVPGSAAVSTPDSRQRAVRLSPSATESGSSLLDGDIAELRRRHLQIPVLGVPTSNLVPTFHQQRATGEHEALDIMASRGTPVVAVEDGRIEKLFTSKRGGLTVYQFDPGETYCYYYAHLDHYAADLQEGASVQRGHTIGFVGSTGNAAEDAPHLHFAVFKLSPEKRWWKGTALDPYLIWRQRLPA